MSDCNFAIWCYTKKESRNMRNASFGKDILFLYVFDHRFNYIVYLLTFSCR